MENTKFAVEDLLLGQNTIIDNRLNLHPGTKCVSFVLYPTLSLAEMLTKVNIQFHFLS